MHSIFMNQQETKTIKYLNKSHIENQPSQNATEKLYSEQQRSNYKKKITGKRCIQSNLDNKEQNNRIYLNDKSNNNFNDVRVENGENKPKNRHTKGKSMDIYQQKVYDKKQTKMSGESKNKNKKIIVNNNYLKDLRQRNSISSINDYNFSKNITGQQRKQFYSNFIKEKKSKEIILGHNKNKKESNLSNKSKNKNNKIYKTNEDKGSKHSEQYTLNYHKSKSYSKSHQIKTERKPPKHYQKQSKNNFLSQFKKNVYTIPIKTKNLIDIYSNNSSLYNSYEKLQLLNRDRSNIILTEISLQLDEIRQYQSMSVNIHSNKSLRKLKKISIIKEINEENVIQKQVFGHHNSTQEIIANYINILAQNQSNLDHQLKDLQDLSIINQKSHQKESNLQLQEKLLGNNSKNLSVKQQKSIINSLIVDRNETDDIIEDKKDKINLNSIINIIKENQNSTLQAKIFIVSQIKELLLKQNKKEIKNHQITAALNESLNNKQRELISKPSNQDQNKQINQIKSEPLPNNSAIQNQSDLNVNQLKQSIQSHQTLQNINLQILDRTLRQREIYLIEKKQKQLLRLYENKYQSQQDLLIQINNLNKWMNHQIKEVVHTRKQLWKGFNLAKQLINQQSFQNSNKSKEMIKCLSDKYLLKNHKKIKTNKEKDLGQSRAFQIKNKLKKKQNKKSEKRTLNKGQRQKQLYKKIKVQHSQQANSISNDSQEKNNASDIDIDVSNLSEQVSEYQLLNSSGKNQNQHSYNQYHQKIKDQNQSQEQQKRYSEEDYDDSHIQNNKILSQATQLEVPIPNISATKPPSLGLNVHKIECQIEQEESFTEEQLILMSKQSQKVKNQSMLIPNNLSLQDKEDIYQFIFLDLCIQLTDQYNHESSIMKKIQSFIKNIKQQSKKQKGFKTNANIIKQYLFQFVTFLKNKSDLLKIVHLNLDKPLGPTAIDILKYMHVYEDEQYEEQSNQNVFILDIQLFQKFQQVYLNTISFEKYYNQEQKQHKRIMFLKNAVHIHNKAIFDALNQILDKHRPYGVWGQPFSWKKTAKFYHVKDVMQKNNVILQSVQRIIDNSSYMCGFMLDKQDCNLKNNPNITQAYIDHIREDRLSRMLANELQQFQEKMLFIDDQQTQILVEIGHMIYQNLINQLLTEIHRCL